MGKVRVEIEIDGNEHTLVLSHKGKELRRIPVGSYAQARAAVERMFTVAAGQPDFERNQMTPEGAAWMSGGVEH